MAKVEIRGLDKLQKKLKKNCSLEDVKTVVLKNGMDMQNKTVKNAVFTKGYSTPYVEFGTRFMDAQPFVRPAFKQQVPIFKSDMKKLVK